MPGRADALATKSPACGERAFAPPPAPDGFANAVSAGHSRSIDQKIDEICTSQADLQPISFKSGRLLGLPDTHDEISTYNRNVLANFDYTADSGWGIAVQLPLLNRAHTHVYNTPVTGLEIEAWNYSELGDMQLIGRYQLVYSFIQKPAHQDVNGVQLTAGRSAVVGIGYRL